MKHSFRNVGGVFVSILFSMSLVAFSAQASDEGIFDLQGQPEVSVKVVEVVEHPVYGVVPAKIEIKDQDSQEVQTLVLDANASAMGAVSGGDAQRKATAVDEREGVRIVAALRAKFPELLGFRVGVRFDDRLEAGIDMGSVAIVSGAGVYLNYHPFDGARGLYIGGKIYRELLVLFGVGTATSYESVLGVRFGPKGDGVYGFFEAGAAVFVNDSNNTDSIVVPSIGIGVGYAF